MSDQTTLFAYKRSQTQGLLSSLGVKFEQRGGYEVVLGVEGEPAKCDVCEKELTANNVGSMAKGSLKLFCDNPACFATHLAKNIY